MTDVRAWRDRRGWTQKQAAEALGLTIDSIKGYETRGQQPSMTVQLLMAALDRIEKLEKKR
jgi:transcriptional regulator with XRE-family HTH domain